MKVLKQKFTLDMSRGKPSVEQLDLSNGILHKLYNQDLYLKMELIAGVTVLLMVFQK